MSKNKPPSFKIVLLGDSGVGKTCIISRYISNTFDRNAPSTNGASYASKNINIEDKEVTLNIWDTAGQEKYKSLTKFFYKDASAAILVYDITSEESFRNMKTYWFEQVKEQGPKNIILSVVGNKSDLYNKEEVKEEDGKQFADKIGAIFELTSAKNNTGINDLYMNIAEKYLNSKIYQDKNKEVEKEKEENENSISFNLNKKDKEKKKCC
jgi:Ras-related protein Rab-22